MIFTVKHAIKNVSVFVGAGWGNVGYVVFWSKFLKIHMLKESHKNLYLVCVVPVVVCNAIIFDSSGFGFVTIYSMFSPCSILRMRC